jgi:hypothetical protein
VAAGAARRLAVAGLAAAALTGCAGQTAPQPVPPACKRFVTVEEVARELGLPVTGVASADLGECRFALGEQTALTVTARVDEHPDDARGLRGVDLEHLPAGGRGSSYRVDDGTETLRAVHGGASVTFSLRTAEQPPPVTDVRPKLVALAARAVDRL